MIPSFDKNGYLHKGIHKASIEEVRERFGKGSLKRKELFKGVLCIVKLLRKHKKDVAKFILNGSYVTDRKEPGDFDYILILKEDFDLDSPEALQLLCSDELFNAHMMFAMENDPVECRQAIDFFGHDKEGKTKGIVEVLL